MYQLPNTHSNDNAERDERRERKRPKSHVSGGIRQVPRISRKEEQQPTRPRRRGHDRVHGGEDEPVAPIFERRTDAAQQAHGCVIQVQKVRQRRERGFP